MRMVVAATAVAAVLAYGLAGHGHPQTSDHDGMMGATIGLCLLVATVLALAAVGRPPARRTLVVHDAVGIPIEPATGRPPDGRARASPRALQRFRN